MTDLKKDFDEFVRSWRTRIALIEERYKHHPCGQLDHLRDRADAYKQFSTELIEVVRDYFVVIDDLHGEMSKISGSSSDRSSRSESPPGKRCPAEPSKEEIITLRCIMAERLDEEKQARDSLIELEKYLNWLASENEQLYERIKHDIKTNSYAAELPKGNKHLMPAQKSLQSNAKDDDEDKSPNLTDSENDDQQKIDVLMHGCKAITMLLKNKHEQMRQQNQRIIRLRDELTKTRVERHSVDNMDNAIAQLKAENSQLARELTEQKTKLGTFDAMQLQYRQTEAQLLEIQTNSREQMQQIHVHSRRIETLTRENKQLVDINMKMMTSIKKCSAELEQYGQMSHTM